MLPKTIPDKLPGAVCAQYVRCGNLDCHCARGGLHGPYWSRFWREDGVRLRKEYVRKADLEAVRAACANWRAEQAEGRQVIRQSERVLRWLTGNEPSASTRQMIEDTLATPAAVKNLFEYAKGQKGDLRLRVRAMGVLFRIKSAAKRDGPRGYSHLLLGR